jgi:hypothetical protein
MNWIDWIEQHLFTCPNKYFFGLDCPGCGMQRSLLEIFRGNVFDSILLYPGLIPMMFTMVMLIVHLRFKLNNGARLLQYSYITSASVVMVSFFIKQFFLHQH